MNYNDYIDLIIFLSALSLRCWACMQKKGSITSDNTCEKTPLLCSSPQENACVTYELSTEVRNSNGVIISETEIRRGCITIPPRSIAERVVCANYKLNEKCTVRCASFIQ